MSGQTLPSGITRSLKQDDFFKERREIEISAREEREKGKHSIGRYDKIN